MKQTFQWQSGLFVLISFFTATMDLASVGLSSKEAIQRLKEGNQRFTSGQSLKPNQSLDRVKELSNGQNPFAVVVGCSDSRVPNEIVFDQGLGDLFIVRTAGQVSTYASWGSIEFAVEVLGAQLILVLGHTNCGAVAAACKVPEVPGHIVTLINSIKPAAEKAFRLPGDHINNSVRVNVAMQVQTLRKLEPVLTKKIKSGQLEVIGGVYDLATGYVEFLDEKFINQMNP